MGEFIEEFYYGNLDPQACSTKQNKTVQKQMEVLMFNEDFLTEHLSGESKKKFLDFCNAWCVVNGESNLDSFIMGFRLGANFTYDTVVSGDSPPKGGVTMEQYIYDESNGLWYERDGDYYITCLKLPETNIGIWGERYLTYIREHKKLLHTKLMVGGTLYDHLAEINRQAEEMFSKLVNQMKTNEGITEQLKADNQMEWVRRMNNIRPRATEIIRCGIQNMQFVDFYRQYADKDSEESREEVAHDSSSEPDKIFFSLERTDAVMTAFENLNYRERAMISAHLVFCMECYATHYYDKDNLDEDGKPTRKPIPEEAFIDIAIDHGLASPDTADKTYRKALGKMKKELKKKDIS